MILPQEDRELLARVGFFLCREGRIPEAEAVFHGLAISAPERDGPVVGQALCMIIKGENEDAVAALDKRLRAGSPIVGSLSLYKLLALGMAGKLREARDLREDMESQGMGEAVKTADLLLEDLSRNNQ